MLFVFENHQLKGLFERFTIRGREAKTVLLTGTNLHQNDVTRAPLVLLRVKFGNNSVFSVWRI